MNYDKLKSFEYPILFPLLCSFLFFYKIDIQSFHYDELHTYLIISQKTFQQFWHAYVHGELSPPLYYLFLKIFDPFVFWDKFTLRFFSAIFTTANLFYFYFFFKKYYSVFFGILLCLLLSASYSIRTFAQEARCYSLFLLLFSISLCQFYILLNQKDKNREFKKLLIYLFALSCTHYIGIAVSITLIILCHIEYRSKFKFMIKLSSAYIFSFVAIITGLVLVSKNIFYINPIEFDSSFKEMAHNLFNKDGLVEIFFLLATSVIAQSLYHQEGLEKEIKFLKNLVFFAIIFIFSVWICWNFIPLKLSLKYILFLEIYFYVVLIFMLIIFFKMTRSFFQTPLRKKFYPYFLCTALVLSSSAHALRSFLTDQTYYNIDRNQPYESLFLSIQNAQRNTEVILDCNRADIFQYYIDKYSINFHTSVLSSDSEISKIQKIEKYVKSKNLNEFYVVHVNQLDDLEFNTTLKIDGYVESEFFKKNKVKAIFYKQM